MLKTTKEVIKGLKEGGNLVYTPSGYQDEHFEFRIDFPNGDYWFLAKTVVKELRELGFIK